MIARFHVPLIALLGLSALQARALTTPDDPSIGAACPEDPLLELLSERCRADVELDWIPEDTPWSWPRSVLLIGGSSMEHGFGPDLADALEAQGVERTTIRARYSTGMARLDYFDWLTAVDTLAEARPDLVIAQFGGNDAQGLRLPGGRREAGWGELAWSRRYQQRMVQLVERFEEAGARVVLLGYPHPTRSGYAGRIAEINESTRAAAVESGAAYLSLWSLTTRPDGRPMASWPDGDDRPLRQADGVHLAPGADTWVAEQVAAKVIDLLEDLESCDARRDDPLPRLARIPVLEFPKPATHDSDADDDDPAGEAVDDTPAAGSADPG